MRIPVLVPVLALAAALLVPAAPAAATGQTCRVMDPTDTPLNLRTAPNGRIVATLPNRLLVQILNIATDARGRAWAYVRTLDGARRMRGWVYREFIACLN